MQSSSWEAAGRRGEMQSSSWEAAEVASKKLRDKEEAIKRGEKKAAKAKRRGGQAAEKRSLSEIKSSMVKVQDALVPLLDALRRTGGPDPWAHRNVSVPLLSTEDIREEMSFFFAGIREEMSRLSTRAEVVGCLRNKGRKVEPSTTDTQVMGIYLEYVFDSISSRLGRIVSDSESISELVKETRDNITTIKRETRIKLDRIEEATRRMETAKGSQSDLISTSAACIEKAADLEEIEEANAMGEESAACIEEKAAAELKEISCR